MKLILAITTVAMLMGTYAAMPSPDTGNLMSLIKELLAAKRNEVSVSGPAVIENKASAAGSLYANNILREMMSASQEEEEAKTAIACLPGPLPICESLQSPAFCCDQPKVLCDVCEYLEYSECCPPGPKSPFHVLDLKKNPEEPEATMQDEEAKMAIACPSGPLPICKSIQSAALCCKHDQVKCDLCDALGLSPCCPSLPPGVLVLDKKPGGRK